MPHLSFEHPLNLIAHTFGAALPEMNMDNICFLDDFLRQCVGLFWHHGMINEVINIDRRGEEQEKAAENAEKKSSIMDRLADAKKECADRKPSEKTEHHKKPPELGDL